MVKTNALAAVRRSVNPFGWIISVAMICGWLVGPRSSAQDASSSGGSQPRIPANQAREDFDFLRRVLEEAHPGLYRYSTQEEIEKGFSKLRGNLRGSMPRPECYEVFAAAVALVRCGHTSLNPDPETMQSLRDAPLFPLTMMIEESRVIVKLNDAPNDSTIEPGMELLEIDGHKIRDLVNRFEAIESSDGDNATAKRIHAERAFGLYYWLLVGQPKVFLVRARDASGRLIEARLGGVPRGQIGKSNNPVNQRVKTGLSGIRWSPDKLALRFLKDPEIAEIRIPSFSSDGFQQWVADTFRILREKKTQSLIIDLRGNGGGADMNGAMLVSFLTDRPFRYFDRVIAKTIEPSFRAHADWSDERTSNLRKEVSPNPSGGYQVTHAGVAEQPPGKHPFLGRVFVLTDGGVFSTAADFCAVTHHLGRATFIGEETGGAYVGNNSGAIAQVILPNSRFQLRLPLYGYWNAVDAGRNGRRGTLPDHLVRATVSDLVRGVDAPLDLAVSLATNNLRVTVDPTVGTPEQR